MMNAHSPYTIEQMARERMKEYHEQAEKDRLLHQLRRAVVRAKAPKNAEPSHKPVLAPNS
jgi:hypothetical protein